MKHYDIKDGRIRSLIDRPMAGVSAGDLGAKVDSELNTQGYEWIDSTSWAERYCTLSGKTRLRGNSRVSCSTLQDAIVVNSNVHFSELIGEHTVIINSDIEDSTVMGGHVSDSKLLMTDVYVSTINKSVVEIVNLVKGLELKDAEIGSGAHYLVWSNIGSQRNNVTLYRTTGGGHKLVVGCWSGDLHSLQAEVERRSKKWVASELQKEFWKQQYKSIYKLGKKALKFWEEHDNV